MNNMQPNIRIIIAQIIQMTEKLHHLPHDQRQQIVDHLDLTASFRPEWVEAWEHLMKATRK